MKVKLYCINEGQASQYFGLMCVDGVDEWVMHYAPNNWKTEAGAKRWAKKHGYTVKGE